MNSDIVLKTIYKENGTNAPELAKAMGIGRAQPLYDIEKGKVKHLSFDYAEKIEAIYPQYFLPWLVTGIGAKYKQPSEIISEDNQNIDDMDIKILLDVIKRQNARLDELESEIAELRRKYELSEESPAV